MCVYLRVGERDGALETLSLAGQCPELVWCGVGREAGGDIGLPFSLCPPAAKSKDKTADAAKKKAELEKRLQVSTSTHWVIDLDVNMLPNNACYLQASLQHL